MTSSLPVRVDKVPVEGVVLNADGSAAADAAVRLHSDEHSFDLGEMLTRTDVNGRFRIFGVAGRHYTVAAYGSGADANSAGEATIVAGAQSGLVIRLQGAAGQE